MSHRRVFAVGAVLAMLVAAAGSAVAQASGNLVEISVNVPKPGMSQQYEAGRKKHMAWHRSQKDPWAYHVWQIASGPDAGNYIVGTFGHNWKDLDGRGKMNEGDDADFGVNLAPHVAKTVQEYWVLRPDLSLNPAAEGDAPMITVANYLLHADQVGAFTDGIKKVNEALKTANYSGPRGRWYQLVNGGEGPAFALVTPRQNWGEMQPPDKTLDAAVAEGGGEAGTAALQSLRKAIKSVRSSILRHRPDLSYIPAP